MFKKGDRIIYKRGNSRRPQYGYIESDHNKPFCSVEYTIKVENVYKGESMWSSRTGINVRKLFPDTKISRLLYV